MKILDGKIVAQHIQEDIKKRPSKKTPHLAVLLVGEHPASLTYVKRKQKACNNVGFSCDIHRFDKDCSEQELLDQIKQFNQDPAIHGILVQLPLPKQINTQKIIQSIDPSKDVDGLHVMNQGKLVSGDPSGFVPCTALGVVKLLDYYQVPTLGKHVVIIGRSLIVGRPLSILLSTQALGGQATVTLAHSKSENLKALCRSADILIAACGQAKLIDSSYLQEGCTVVDVGISKTDEGKLCGDVDFENVSCIADISPVPGGVGPMTIAMLLENLYKACNSK